MTSPSAVVTTSAPPEASASAKNRSSFSAVARSDSGCSSQISGSFATATNASWSEGRRGRSRSLGPCNVGWRSKPTCRLSQVVRARTHPWMEGYLDASLRLGGLWRSGVHDGLEPDEDPD